MRWPSRRGVTVEQGQVIITDVYLISRSRHHRAWHVECHSKYPVLLGTTGSKILLHADEHTIKYDRDTEMPTAITFSAPDGWTLFCEERGRYSLMVVAFRQNVVQRLWHDYETQNNPRCQHPPEGK